MQGNYTAITVFIGYVLQCMYVWVNMQMRNQSELRTEQGHCKLPAFPAPDITHINNLPCTYPVYYVLLFPTRKHDANGKAAVSTDKCTFAGTFLHFNILMKCYVRWQGAQCLHTFCPFSLHNKLITADTSKTVCLAYYMAEMHLRSGKYSQGGH